MCAFDLVGFWVLAGAQTSCDLHGVAFLRCGIHTFVYRLRLSGCGCGMGHMGQDFAGNDVVQGRVVDGTGVDPRHEICRYVGLVVKHNEANSTCMCKHCNVTSNQDQKPRSKRHR